VQIKIEIKVQMQREECANYLHRPFTIKAFFRVFSISSSSKIKLESRSIYSISLILGFSHSFALNFSRSFEYEYIF